MEKNSGKQALEAHKPLSVPVVAALLYMHTGTALFLQLTTQIRMCLTKLYTADLIRRRHLFHPGIFTIKSRLKAHTLK